MTPGETTQLLKELLRAEGFERVGVAPARAITRGDYVRGWLESGLAGEMAYLSRHQDKRLDPAKLLPGARSVVVAGLSYHQPRPPAPGDGPRGKVAMYAWGDDYHDVIKRKLWSVIDRLRETLSEPFEAKPCVDTAPIIERELAMAAGVGWIGKNTLVLHQDLGSYFFLGEIVTTLDLVHDAPATDHCGSCTRCLEACPTAAFTAPYQMDARRCISYHTIELRSEIPVEFQQSIGDWVYGCDVCQEVCPFNAAAPQTTEPRFAVRDPGPNPPLLDLLEWQGDDYRQNLKGSAMKRATLDMLKRNAQIVLDNLPHANP